MYTEIDDRSHIYTYTKQVIILMCYYFSYRSPIIKSHFFYLDVSMQSLKIINHYFDSSNVQLEFLVFSYNLYNILPKAVNLFTAVIKTTFLEKACLPFLYDKLF